MSKANTASIRLLATTRVTANAYPTNEIKAIRIAVGTVSAFKLSLVQEAG
jgi:hypothetical protein